MEDVFIRYANLPTTIASFVVTNPDATFTIMLNSKLCHERLVLAYEHELRHIRNGDYDRKCGVDLVEVHAHK